MAEPIVVTNLKIPYKLHLWLKDTARRNNTSMTALLIGMIERAKRESEESR